MSKRLGMFIITIGIGLVFSTVLGCAFLETTPVGLFFMATTVVVGMGFTFLIGSVEELTDAIKNPKKPEETSG